MFTDNVEFTGNVLGQLNFTAANPKYLKLSLQDNPVSRCSFTSAKVSTSVVIF